jgi:hypothetical protein
MLVSVRGLKWEEVCVVPLAIYLDDSGTSPSQQVAIATALIIPAKQIIRMESEWATLKAKEGFADFHTSEFVAKNPKSEFANWDDAKQKRVFLRVRQITKKYVCQIISMAVNKPDYENILPDEFRKYSGKHHYSWALRHVISFAQLFKLNGGTPEPYEWVFDWMERKDPSRKEVETVLEQAEEMAILERSVSGEYTNYSFRRRATLAGLQCADLVAWTNYQYALEKFKGTPIPPFAKIAWDAFASMPDRSVPSINKVMEWNFSVAIKRDHLQDWVKQELADGRSLIRFREFEEKKKALKAKGAKTHAARTK